MIAVENFKETRQLTTPLSIAWTTTVSRTTCRIATRTTSITFRWASPFWRSAVTVTTSFRLTITFWLACVRSITSVSASFTFRLASVSLWFASFTVWLTSRFTTSTFRGSAFTFARLSERDHIIERQRFFLRTLEHRSHAVAKLFGNFVERDLAVTVRVHPFELLFRILIRTATRSARSRSTGRWTKLCDRAAEFFLSQLRLAELLKHFGEPIAQPFRQFVLLQLAIVVFVEPLQELTGTTPRTAGHHHHPAAAFEVFFAAAAENPVVGALLAPDGSGEELLALVTTQGGPVVERATGRLAALLASDWPQLSGADVSLLSETVVRLAISYLTLPGGDSHVSGEAVARLLGPYVERALGRD